MITNKTDRRILQQSVLIRHYVSDDLPRKTSLHYFIRSEVQIVSGDQLISYSSYIAREAVSEALFAVGVGIYDRLGAVFLGDLRKGAAVDLRNAGCSVFEFPWQLLQINDEIVPVVVTVSFRQKRSLVPPYHGFLLPRHAQRPAELRQMGDVGG